MNHTTETNIENQPHLIHNLAAHDNPDNDSPDGTAKGLLEDATNISPVETLHSEALPQFGITVEALAAVKANKSRRSSGHVSFHTEAIRNAAPKLIEMHGTNMFRAKPVFDYLKNNNLCISATGQPLEFANFVGDAMGKGGLNLPRLRKSGKLVYAINYVNSSDQEKEEAQVVLDNLSTTQLKAMKTV